MISARRITAVFRRKGRSGDLTKLASEFTAEQLSPILNTLGGEQPLIVGRRSVDNWFALTNSLLVSKDHGTLHRIPLDEIVSVDCDVRQLSNGKRHGGRIEFNLRDGSLASVVTESGGPYVAMLNVFRYLAQVNRTPTGRPMVGPRKAQLTTNDEPLTTGL